MCHLCDLMSQYVNGKWRLDVGTNLVINFLYIVQMLADHIKGMDVSLCTEKVTNT